VTSQGTAPGFTRAVATKNLREAEMAARELGALSLEGALKLCVMLAERDAQRFERAALRWLRRFIEERLPPIAEVALAATALAELRHGVHGAGGESLKHLASRRSTRIFVSCDGAP
jgi:hypothetical protein